ncbi:MAG: metallophosphoesterase [Polyangiaceae bacterium]
MRGVLRRGALSSVLAALLLAVGACSCGGPGKGPEGPSGVTGTETGTADSGAPKRDWAVHPAIVMLDGVADLYAMGDVHGDPDAQMRTLVNAGLAAAGDPPTWTGGKATLVVTGDVIDKGDQSMVAIANFIALEKDAAAKGGRVIVTSGNHEAEFLADPSVDKADEFRKELKAAGEKPKHVARGEGVIGEWLRTRPYGVLAGDWFFSHAGDTAGDDGAPRSAKALDVWFQGTFDKGQLDVIAKANLLQARKDWWSDSPEKSSLDAVLAALPAKHLVYGHQPGEIPCKPDGDRPKQTLATCYDGKVFFLDVGMSKAVNPSSPGGLLHIEIGPPAKVTALVPGESPRKVWSAPR